MIIHNHLAQYDSAAFFGEKVVARFSDEPVTWAQIGFAYHELGDDKKAMFAVDSALAIFDGLAMAHYFRAMILLTLGNSDEAIDEIANAIELFEPYRDEAATETEFKPLMKSNKFRKLIEQQ